MAPSVKAGSASATEATIVGAAMLLLLDASFSGGVDPRDVVTAEMPDSLAAEGMRPTAGTSAPPSRDPKTQQIPVLMVTTKDQDTDKE